METFLALFVVGSLIYAIVTGILVILKSGTRNYKRSRNGLIVCLVSFICYGVLFTDEETETAKESTTVTEQVEESEVETVVPVEEEDVPEEEIQGEEEVVQEETQDVAPTQNEGTGTYPNIIQSMNREEVRKIVKENAEENWGTDFSMIEFEIDLVMEAFDWLYELDIENEIEKGILESAFDTWGYDFNMVKFEYEIQLESFQNLYG